MKASVKHTRSGEQSRARRITKQHAGRHARRMGRRKVANQVIRTGRLAVEGACLENK